MPGTNGRNSGAASRGRSSTKSSKRSAAKSAKASNGAAVRKRAAQQSSTRRGTAGRSANGASASAPKTTAGRSATGPRASSAKTKARQSAGRNQSASRSQGSSRESTARRTANSRSPSARSSGRKVAPAANRTTAAPVGFAKRFRRESLGARSDRAHRCACGDGRGRYRGRDPAWADGPAAHSQGARNPVAGQGRPRRRHAPNRRGRQTIRETRRRDPHLAREGRTDRQDPLIQSKERRNLYD